MSEEVKIVCGDCGVEYCIPENLYNERVNDHKSFYCPNGHNSYFPGKSDIEKSRQEIAGLRSRIDQLENLLDWTEKSRSAYIGHFNRLKKQSLILMG